MSETSALSARLIGEIFVARGLVTDQQLERALEIQAEQGGRLGEIIVAEFGVSRVEMAGVLAEQWAEMERSGRDDRRSSPPVEPAPAAFAIDGGPSAPLDGNGEEQQRPLGSIFVERGYVSEGDLERALEAQRESGQRLGEILVEQGSITRLDLASALAEQWAGMQKLRPPEPKPPTPWQQAAPEGLVAVQAEKTEAVAADTDELRRAIASLQERMRAAEAAGGKTVSHDLLEAAQRLEARVAALESRLEDVAAPQQDPAALQEVRVALAGLQEQLSGPEQRLAAVEERIASLPSVEAVEEGMRAELAQLGGRLDALAASVSDTGSLDELRGSLASLEQRLDSGVDSGTVEGLSRAVAELAERFGALERRADEAPQQDPAALEEVRVALAGLQERLSGPEQRLAVVEERLSGMVSVEAMEEAIRAELAQLGRRLDGLASSVSDTASLDALRGSLSRLEQRLDSGAGSASLVGTVEGLSRAVAELAERFGALERRADEVPQQDPAALDEVRASLAEVRSRLTEPAMRLDAVEHRLGALPSTEAVDERVHDAVAGLSGALDGVAARLAAVEAASQQLPRQDAALDEVRAALTGLRELASSPADNVEALATRLGVLEAAVHQAQPHDPAPLDELRNGLAELHRRLDAPDERLEAVERQLSELPTAAAIEGQIHEGLRTLGARLDAVAASLVDPSSIDAVRASLVRLEERLDAGDTSNASLAGAVDAVSRNVGELVGRVHTAEQSLTALAGTPTPDFRDAEAVRAELARADELAVARVDEVAAPLRAQVEALERRLAELAAAEETGASAAVQRAEELHHGALERLDALASSAAREEDVESLRQELTGMQTELSRSVRFDEAEKLISGLTSDLAGLAERIAASETATAAMPDAESFQAQVDARCAELEHHLTQMLERAGNEAAGRVEEVEAAMQALRTAQAEQRESTEHALRERAGAGEVEALGARVAGLDGVGARLDALEALSVRRDEIEAVAERTRLLEARLAEGALRVELTAFAGDVRAEITAVDARLGETAGRAEGTQTAVDALAGSLEGMWRERVEREVQLDERLTAETAGLRRGLDELHEALADRDEWRGRVEVGLDHRIDEIAGRLDAGQSTTKAALAGIGIELAGLRDTAGELRAELANEAEASRTLVAEVAAQVDDAARRAAGNVAEATAAVRSELGALAARLEQAQAERAAELEQLAHRAHVEVDELRGLMGTAKASADAERQALAAELDRFSASLGWRLEQVEQALATSADDELLGRMADVEQRLEAEAARSTEQVRVTERAVRKGLAALGARLAETEAGYAEAGAALRRSIERLGHAIVEADLRTAERDDEELLAVHGRVAESFVAFAPTREGYRLVAVDAPPPAVGDVVELEGHRPGLLVTRVGASPLPFDTRPCAYLEPVGADYPPSERPLPE